MAYAPDALYPQNVTWHSLLLDATVRLEGLAELKNPTRDLPASNSAPTKYAASHSKFSYFAKVA
jgi:hypothetical protein